MRVGVGWAEGEGEGEGGWLVGWSVFVRGEAEVRVRRRRERRSVVAR